MHFRLAVGSNVKIFGFNVGLVVWYKLAGVDGQSSSSTCIILDGLNQYPLSVGSCNTPYAERATGPGIQLTERSLAAEDQLARQVME